MDSTRDQKNQTGQNQPTIIPQDQESPAPPSGEPTPAKPVDPGPLPTPLPQVPEDQKTPEPVIPPVSEEAETAGLPPIISPPKKKKGLPISMFGIVALLLLVVSIPVGVFLVKQTQELRGRAYEAANCDEEGRGGLQEETQDCDVNTNQLVQVFVCNNGERLPGTPTDQACPGAPRPPQEPAPTPIPSDQDADRNLGGGCCDPGAADNSPTGCRRGSGFNEVCDISNGVCASGFSCRSIAGCTQDSDCGPGNACRNSQCQPNPPPAGQYTSCTSWGFSDDPSNTADPTCETDPNKNGFSCRRPDGVAVCAYRNGTWYEGQQGNCENLGNGTIRINVSATIDEYHCSNQTSSTESCFEGKTTRGLQGPGTYTVGGDNCGGHQIDANGLCGSYTFRGACRSTQPILQCTAVKFYDTNWNLISNPQAQIRANQTIRIAVVSSPGAQWAEFRINGGVSWERTTQKNASNEFFIERQISAGDGGRFSVEARVY